VPLAAGPNPTESCCPELELQAANTQIIERPRHTDFVDVPRRVRYRSSTLFHPANFLRQTTVAELALGFHLPILAGDQS
jgi:hypothetical protein